jgi:hypothetical protein
MRGSEEQERDRSNEEGNEITLICFIKHLDEEGEDNSLNIEQTRLLICLYINEGELEDNNERRGDKKERMRDTLTES